MQQFVSRCALPATGLICVILNGWKDWKLPWIGSIFARREQIKKKDKPKKLHPPVTCFWILWGLLIYATKHLTSGRCAPCAPFTLSGTTLRGASFWFCTFDPPQRDWEIHQIIHNVNVPIITPLIPLCELVKELDFFARSHKGLIWFSLGSFLPNPKLVIPESLLASHLLKVIANLYSNPTIKRHGIGKLTSCDSNCCMTPSQT